MMIYTEQEKKDLEEDLKFIVDLKRNLSDLQMFIASYGLIKGVNETQLEEVLNTEKTVELYYFELKKKQREMMVIAPTK